MGLMSADVGVTALPDGTPCSIAVEYDGATHFMIEHSSNGSAGLRGIDGCYWQSNGPTHLRNALLRIRFPDGVVCIPWREWVPATQAGQQEEYLRRVMALLSYALGELHNKLALAKPQGVSNAVYGCALAGHVEGLPQLLNSVCQQPQVMARAKPQEWSNTIWAAAKLGCSEQGAVLMNRVADLPQVMNQAKPQVWSNILWAAAKLECVREGSVLVRHLADHPQVMTQAKPQEWSNALWAAATLHKAAVDTSSNAGVINMLQKGGHLLLQACASSPTALQEGISQAWSNTLWAAAVLCWYNRQLFSRGAAPLAAVPPAEVKPQEFSNAMYACALCAHWVSNTQQLLGKVDQYDLAAFAPQASANTLYAWAVLYFAAETSEAAQHR
jgi:hypothetical protein